MKNLLFVCVAGSVAARASPAGRLDRRHSIESGIENRVCSESLREDVDSRVLTIRCKAR
jgi:hypothetical protein